MANFSAYQGGICIESVSHLSTLTQAKRYFSRRHKEVEFPLIVISAGASQKDVAAAIEKSKTKLQS